MGGCLSSKRVFLPGRRKPRSRSEEEDPAVQSERNGTAVAPLPAPPLPPEEEAVVKEVLTETPNPSAAVAVVAAACRRAAADGAALKLKSPEKDVVAPAAVKGGADAMSGEETSEMCSVSESFSVSTTLTEKTEDAREDTATSRRGKRPPPEWSPPGKSCHPRRRFPSGEFAAGAGGGRARSSRLRTRRSEDMSSLARDASRARLQLAGNGRAPAAGMGRNQDDWRERRSASPAGKRLADLRAAGGEGGMSRSSSARRVERAASPHRAFGPSPEANNKMRGAGAGAAGAERGGEGEVEERRTAAAGGESLENPLVSLECFIFL
ncbi:unnamed protein product [Spirodela intermedia]|uniref:Uncharacterized protein n=1 Tax=Spirodela intermedia TaxID=51605 RepID=A0A7I8KAC4_SPIIN|nr:unnamed protein product [Spirodela intermedia]